MNKCILLLLTFLFMVSHSLLAETADNKPDWTDTLTLKGDVRARFESIDEDGKDVRERGRIRARLGAYAAINENVDAAIAIASGEDDPVSANQTLGDGFSSKPIRLDLAYIDLHREPWMNGHLVLGKMKNPFIAVNNLQWDGDLNPEGAAINLAYPAGDSFTFLINGGSFWLAERSSSPESMLYGLQAAALLDTEAITLLGGVSYFIYDNMKGYETLFDSTDSFGNSAMEEADDTLTYMYEYEIAEYFASIAFSAGLPVKITGSYVENQEVDDNNRGYMVALSLGKRKDPGSVDFSYSYRSLEADAVVGVFADSDIGGGGTDIKGHQLSCGYQIGKNLVGNATYFISQKGIKEGIDYDRLQLDLTAKF